jgi:CHAT domain-containing protein
MIRGQPVPAEALSSRGMGQEEAAGQASLSHPYYWSAFMLLGNWL